MWQLLHACFHRFKQNDFLGQIFLDLSDATIVDNKPHWYKLHDKDELMTNRLSKPVTSQHGATV